MDKLALYNKLKAEGKIPEGVKVDDVTDAYLINLDVNSSGSGTNTNLSMDDFKAEVYKDFENKLKANTDAIDRKYLKLPNADLTDEEEKLPADKKANLKMRKFLNFLYSGGKLALNTEGTTTTGGFTVPVEFIARVSTLLAEYGIFRRSAFPMQMNSMTATMPKLNAAPTGAFVNETAAKPESNPTFTQITFTRHDYAFITGLSKQLLQDTGVNLIELLARLAANDFAKTEDTQGFKGTGSPITGVYASVVAAGNIITLSGQAPSTLTNAKLLSLLTAIIAEAMPGAKLYMHRAILGLILALVDGQSRPIYNADMVMSTRMLNGVPFELSEVLNDATSGSAIPIILYGNLKYATFASRENFNIALSDTATVGGNSAFEKNLVFYRFEESYDIQVEQPTAFAKIVTLT